MDVDDLWYRADGTPKARCGKGMRWRARWRDPDGAQHGKSFVRKLDAERHVAETHASKSRGSYIDPKAGRILLRSYAAAWLQALTAGPTTIATVRSRLDNQILPQLGGYELRQLEPSVVASWYAAFRRRQLSDGYARECRSTLSAILTAAVDDRKIGSNPCLARSATPPRRTGGRKVVPWSQAQVLAVAENIDQRYRALVLTGAAEGLRQGELLGLAVEDVDFLRRVIHVRRQLVRGGKVFALPKGQKTRDVPLADSVSLALARQLELHPPAAITLPWESPDARKRVTALLFWSHAERPWDASHWLRSVWFPALSKSKISFNSGSGDGCHALRHYAASSWLSGGVSIRAVAEYMGHTDPAFTLRIYAHLMPAEPDRMRQAADLALQPAASRRAGRA